MDLKETYFKLEKIISGVDFEKLWKGFAPFKFAIYNDDEVFFNGTSIIKEECFRANTSILYKGEYIAIWYLNENTDLEVLASKLIHEMFHAYQYSHQWNCFANELEAVVKYTYNPQNLVMKKKENEYLAKCLSQFSPALWDFVIASRKYRLQSFAYEYEYEAKVEAIEGSATFVELRALRQINSKKAEELTNKIISTVTDVNSYFPIRIVLYYSGCLTLLGCEKAGQLDRLVENYYFGYYITQNTQPRMIEDSDSKMIHAYEQYQNEFDNQIDKTLEQNDIVLDKDVKLLALNIYDAKSSRGYVTSKYLCMFEEDGQEKTLYGNFLIKMRDDKTIEKIYNLSL